MLRPNNTVVENEEMGLCVTELEGRQKCLTDPFNLSDRISVSDSKEVLIVIGTGNPHDDAYASNISLSDSRVVAQYFFIRAAAFPSGNLVCCTTTRLLCPFG